MILMHQARHRDVAMGLQHFIIHSERENNSEKCPHFGNKYFVSFLKCYLILITGIHEEQISFEMSAVSNY